MAAHGSRVPPVHLAVIAVDAGDAWWLVSYDITDDSARRRVSDILGGHGTRRLYSAFEVAPVSDRVMGELLDVVAVHLRPTDHVLATPVCAGCTVHVSGGSVEWPLRHGGEVI